MFFWAPSLLMDPRPSSLNSCSCSCPGGWLRQRTSFFSGKVTHSSVLQREEDAIKVWLTTAWIRDQLFKSQLPEKGHPSKRLKHCHGVVAGSAHHSVTEMSRKEWAKDAEWSSCLCFPAWSIFLKALYLFVNKYLEVNHSSHHYVTWETFFIKNKERRCGVWHIIFSPYAQGNSSASEKRSLTLV